MEEAWRGLELNVHWHLPDEELTLPEIPSFNEPFHNNRNTSQREDSLVIMDEHKIEERLADIGRSRTNDYRFIDYRTRCWPSNEIRA
jgi:hypothetical protein